jgi:hypothetical protein
LFNELRFGTPNLEPVNDKYRRDKEPKFIENLESSIQKDSVCYSLFPEKFIIKFNQIAKNKEDIFMNNLNYEKKISAPALEKIIDQIVQNSGQTKKLVDCLLFRGCTGGGLPFKTARLVLAKTVGKTDITNWFAEWAHYFWEDGQNECYTDYISPEQLKELDKFSWQCSLTPGAFAILSKQFLANGVFDTKVCTTNKVKTGMEGYSRMWEANDLKNRMTLWRGG